MKIEKLRKSHKNKIIVGGLIGLGVIGAITILPSHAKYRLTDSINIANGVVNYKVPDFQIVGMYKSDDGTNYTELDGRMPKSGYIINEEKSYCNLITGGKDTEAILKTVEGNHVIANLIKGDKCYLYFDKKTTETVNTALGPIEVQLATPDFSKTAPNDIEGIFAAEDGMYGGTSYYWRGAVTNNYVKFAGLCWRIIRINGDGTIRLIYDGESCHVNGENADSIVATSQTYSKDGVFNRSEYVGYTYASGSQRPSDNATGTASNLKTQTESWYKPNITDKGFDGKVATGKFCNDRETANGSTWSSQPSYTFYYAGHDRSGKKSESSVTPTLDCPKESGNNDIYNLKAGAITMDEVIMAGGKWSTANSSYYLYNGQNYWTMSPSYWWYNSSTSRYAGVFYVNSNGQFHNWSVSSTGPGVRPVINLLSDTEFKSGTDGTLNNPYEVI